MRSLAALAAGGILLAAPAHAGTPVAHEIRSTIDPALARLSVVDRIEFDPAEHGDSAVFLLHGNLLPRPASEGVRIEELARPPIAKDFGVPPERFHLPSAVPWRAWRLTLPAGMRRAEIAYEGEIHHPVENRDEDYARSFGETPGTISPEGVFLSGATLWVPWLGPEPFTFSIETSLPAGWDAVSQGRRARHESAAEGTRVRWESPEPQTEVYLVAARFVETSRRFGKVEAMTFLREADPALSAKYLEATGRYLSMYEGLLGPYPYAKFALVENFWETGYGMPSFTLLGSKVMRLPFIVNSSYPHEILHSWWGNGVFVDAQRGNWCEGLTAYLADHLLQEQQGNGADYRQTTLQKYTDYVSKGKDLPLAEFRERHSPATEAVGYGKALMLFHMLRRELGDATFVKGLRQFYEKNRFREASFGNLEAALEEVSQRDLRPFFQQGVERAGAPQLALADTRVVANGRSWEVQGTVVQTQPGPKWRLEVPFVVTMEGREEGVEGTLVSEGPSSRLVIERLPARPLRIDIDPAFDLFRKLDPAEIPPALSGAFGASRALVVLPSAASPELLAAYRTLAADWAKSEPERLEVKLDSEVAAIPADRAAWIFGWENRHRAVVERGVAAYGATLDAGAVAFDGRNLDRADHAAAVVVRHPERADLVVAWVAADRAAQVPGLGRKLPHYHKYSYLAFEGDEPVNVVKGRWAAVGSPLTVLLPGANGRPERGRIDPRPALATLPPAFSTARMRETVAFLADEAREGRAAGTTGAEAAADDLVAQFRAAGLKPAGEGGGFVQSWTARLGGGDAVLKNVIGAIPGAKPEFNDQSVVVAAHYDHLGRGLFDVRAGNEGKIHPGADDNASGVAVLLELARAFASGPPPDRTIVFAAFTGEEAGLLGSRRFVASLGPEAAARVRGAVNLDTVGRLGSGKLLVLGSGSAAEWVHIARGAGFVTGVPVESVAKDPGGSDQVAFHEAGIPAVQFFTGPHDDYHAPGDTSEKVDYDGLAKVAAVAREFVEYLAGRVETLTTTLAGGGTPSAPRAGEGRRVSIGVVPDFAFAGTGVRLSGVVAGSPAENAGLREGDVLERVAGVEVRDLASYSAVLKGLKPGEKVPLVARRGVDEIAVEVEVAAR